MSMALSALSIPIATKRNELAWHWLRVRELWEREETHNMSQAARISDYSMFMYLGDLVEYDQTRKMFTSPSNKRTEQYLTGKFG